MQWRLVCRLRNFQKAVFLNSIVQGCVFAENSKSSHQVIKITFAKITGSTVLHHALNDKFK